MPNDNPQFPRETALVVEAIAVLVDALRHDSGELASVFDRIAFRLSFDSREKLILLSMIHPSTGAATPFVAINADPHDREQFGAAGLPAPIVGLHRTVASEHAN